MIQTILGKQTIYIFMQKAYFLPKLLNVEWLKEKNVLADNKAA